MVKKAANEPKKETIKDSFKDSEKSKKNSSKDKIRGLFSKKNQKADDAKKKDDES